MWMLWIPAIVLAAWIAYRVGVAVESGREDETIEDVERDLHTERQRLISEREQAAERYGVLEQRYWRVIDAFAHPPTFLPAPNGADSTEEPLTVAQADRLVVEERKKARAREEAQADGATEGMELVAVADDEALPVTRVEEPEADG